MVFAAIRNALFAQQFHVDLVPPRLGIGEHAVEIEDHCREWFSHAFALVFDLPNTPCRWDEPMRLILPNLRKSA